jgi:hypothetical protein
MGFAEEPLLLISVQVTERVDAQNNIRNRVSEIRELLHRPEQNLEIIAVQEIGGDFKHVRRGIDEVNLIGVQRKIAEERTVPASEVNDRRRRGDTCLL